MGRKQTRDPIPAYRAIARRFGLRYRLLTWYPLRAYNAKGVFNLVKLHADHASHELAHYLVATPAQRRMPEYGLGSTAFFADTARFSGTSSRQHVAAGMSEWDATEIEGEASMLGIWIMLRVEGRTDAEDMFGRHVWAWPTALETTRDLLRKKLVIWHKGRLTPRCLVRPPRKHEVFQRKAST